MLYTGAGIFIRPIDATCGDGVGIVQRACECRLRSAGLGHLHHSATAARTGEENWSQIVSLLVQ